MSIALIAAVALAGVNVLLAGCIGIKGFLNRLSSHSTLTNRTDRVQSDIKPHAAPQHHDFPLRTVDQLLEERFPEDSDPLINFLLHQQRTRIRTQRALIQQRGDVVVSPLLDRRT